jgi:hypothetical protein
MKNYSILILFLFCFFQIGASAQFAPYTTAGSLLTFDQQFVVPVTVTDFNNVASCNLRLTYNPSVVVATLVAKGPGLPGSLNYNVTSVPGVVSLGWYHSANVSLPDDAVLFNISFSQVGIGSTSLSWFDNGNSCKYSDINSTVLLDQPTNDFYINGNVVILSPNAPQTILPPITACPGSLISVPVIVNNFSYIGSVALELQYDPAVVTYQGAAVSSTYPGLNVTVGASGHLLIQGLAPAGGNGISIQSGSILTSLDFLYNGGATSLAWLDNGISCQYSGPPPNYSILNDLPQASFYTNGSVSAEVPGPCGKTLSLELFLQGLYVGSGSMREASDGNGSAFGNGIADHINVELHSSSDYSNIVFSSQNINLNTDGSATLIVPSEFNSDYFITIRHRNSISVTSSVPVSFFGGIVQYNFTDDAGKAFGSNQIMLNEGLWALFTGDIDQDNHIDGADLILADNAAISSASGYFPSDSDGDGVVDIDDVNLIEGNASNFVKAVFPSSE